MASVQKFTHAAVANQLRHCNRRIRNDSNKDIDYTRTYLNYSLTPKRTMSEYRYYNTRKAELYCYGRNDVKTMCGWIVTAPKELDTPEEERAFFEGVYDFLKERYGGRDEENVISATVHYDEGKMEKVVDRWGHVVTKEDGTPEYKLVLGRPHLHFDFIPVVPDKNPKHVQREKICANDVLTKVELKRFHSDLQRYLSDKGIKGEVLTGITKAKGRNYTVAEMKEQYDLNKELLRLREIERKYNMEHDRTITWESRW